MPGGYKNIGPEDGIDTRFKPGEVNNPNGRPVSIKRQLRELLIEDGSITFDKKQVVAVHEDGSVTLKVPTEMQLAMKLQSWAMSRRGQESLKAIQMIMEQIDGKPKQETETTHKIADYTSWSDRWIDSDSAESRKG